MSEESDALARAVTQQMRLAASCQRRQEEAEAEATRLRAEHDAADPGREELRAALLEKINALRAEAMAADMAKQAALVEVAQLRKLAGRLPAMEAQALAAEVRALAGGADESGLDDTGPLDAARAHIADLDAQARIGAELTGSDEKSRPTTMSEEEARAQLAALRAARSAPASKSLGDGSTPAADDPTPADDAPANPRPKRTL